MANKRPKRSKPPKPPKPAFDMDPDAPYNPKELARLRIPLPKAPTVQERLTTREEEKYLRNLAIMLKFAWDKSIVIMVPFTMKELEERSKRSGKTLEDETTSRFADRLPNPFTTRYISADGVLLLWYLGFQNPDVTRFYTYNNQPTTADLKAYQQANPHVTLYHNGMQHDVLMEHWRETQACMALVSPKPREPNDRRHRVDVDRDLQRSYYFRHNGPTGEGPAQAELIATGHLVVCWTQKGHPHDPMTPSKDHNRFAATPDAVNTFHKNSWKPHQYLRKVFEKGWPDAYKKFSKAHKNAVAQDHPGLGPWIGKAIVWKASSSGHIDDGDGCPTATYPFGVWEGGHMDVHDLNARLLYQQRDVIVGHTSVLFHRVTPWTVPTIIDPQVLEYMKKYNITPGRVSEVSFFPQAAYDQLVGKSPGWGPRTKWGSMAEVEDDQPKRKKRRKNKVVEEQ